MKESQLFGEPLPVSPATNGGLSLAEETLWVARLVFARNKLKRLPKKGRETAKWLKIEKHVVNFICAANYRLLLTVAKATAKDDENLADEIESYLGRVLFYAVSTHNPNLGRLSPRLSTALSQRAARLAAKEKKHSGHFKTTTFMHKGREGGDDDARIVSPLLAFDAESERRATSDNIEALTLAMQSAKLTNPERLVLDLRFRQDLTLEEAGNRMKLTRERIRQIQNKALKKLRDVMEGVAA